MWKIQAKWWPQAINIWNLSHMINNNSRHSIKPSLYLLQALPEHSARRRTYLPNVDKHNNTTDTKHTHFKGGKMQTDLQFSTGVERRSMRGNIYTELISAIRILTDCRTYMYWLERKNWEETVHTKCNYRENSILQGHMLLGQRLPVQSLHVANSKVAGSKVTRSHIFRSKVTGISMLTSASHQFFASLTFTRN